MGDKNLQLVKSIEKFPCIYNCNMIDYSKKDVTDKAWNEIAHETKLSVIECKEKWKNLRYGFIRSLKPNQDGSVKKKYYLHDEMEFVLPFIKLIPKNISYVQPHVDDDTDEEIIENVENGQPSHLFDLGLLHNSEPPRKKRRTKDYLNCVQHRRYENNEDARRMFLLSLLPEVNELNNSQMRIFKRKVLALLDEIVDTSNQHDNKRNQWQINETQDTDSSQDIVIIKKEMS